MTLTITGISSLKTLSIIQACISTYQNKYPTDSSLLVKVQETKITTWGKSGTLVTNLARTNYPLRPIEIVSHKWL
jgi:hypothetical protein